MTIRLWPRRECQYCEETLPWWAALRLWYTCDVCAFRINNGRRPHTPQERENIVLAKQGYLWRIVCDDGRVPHGQGSYPVPESAEDVLALHERVCPAEHAVVLVPPGSTVMIKDEHAREAG